MASTSIGDLEIGSLLRTNRLQRYAAPSTLLHRTCTCKHCHFAHLPDLKSEMQEKKVNLAIDMVDSTVKAAVCCSLHEPINMKRKK